MTTLTKFRSLLRDRLAEEGNEFWADKALDSYANLAQNFIASVSVEPADGNPHTKGKSLEEINEYMRTVPGADDWSYTFKYRIAELTEEAKKKISDGSLESSDFYSLGIFEQ